MHKYRELPVEKVDIHRHQAEHVADGDENHRLDDVNSGLRQNRRMAMVAAPVIALVRGRTFVRQIRCSSACFRGRFLSHCCSRLMTSSRHLCRSKSSLPLTGSDTHLIRGSMGPPAVHTPSGTSIGTVVFAALTVSSR